MSSPHEVRCMEFVAKRRHGIKPACISLRMDTIRDFVASPYRGKLRIPSTPAA